MDIEVSTLNKMTVLHF